MITPHTPGPWSKMYDTHVYAERHQLIAICEGAASWDETFANARLIAAAPDLLAALRDLESAVSHYFRGFSHLHPSIERPLLAARKVLDVADDAPPW